MTNKENILNVLTENWKSTTKVAQDLATNYYIAINLLYELQREDKIEKLEIGAKKYWRKKI